MGGHARGRMRGVAEAVPGDRDAEPCEWPREEPAGERLAAGIGLEGTVVTGVEDLLDGGARKGAVGGVPDTMVLEAIEMGGQPVILEQATSIWAATEA